MNQTITFSGKTLRLVLLVVIAFQFNFSYAQKDKEITPDKFTQKIARTDISVRTAKFQSAELKNATSEYRAMMKSGPETKNAILSLRNKGYSHATILGSVRYARMRDLNFTFTVISNTEIAEDAQLMFKAIPGMTAAEMINAIRELYDVSTIKLFNIALLTSQDSTVRITQPKSFNYRCDCKIRNLSDVTNYRPFRTSKTQYETAYSYFKKLYPWQCMDFWNTGFRSVILPETNLNDFLHSMKLSDYPFYDGITSADLGEPAIDFKLIMGNTAGDLVELMESATLAYLPTGTTNCQYEYPSQTSMSFNEDYKYSGTCKHASIIKTRHYLKEILNVLKRNGYTMTVLATAAKNRFGIPDDDMKQKILASFDPSVFSAAEILQASNVLNSN